ncbi:hypothetical protein M1466_00265 [Candidatus Dependentiae bacterium]|nr:hypothetical protein [Candidatus Dependentiae bacterium]
MNFPQYLANRNFQHVTFLCFLLMLFVVGCGKKRMRRLQQQRALPTIEEYRIDLIGVECPACAQHAVIAAEKVPGVIKAYYRAPRENIAAGHLGCLAHCATFIEHSAELADLLLPHALQIKSVQGLFPHQGRWQPVVIRYDAQGATTIVDIPVPIEQKNQENDNRLLQ